MSNQENLDAQSVWPDPFVEDLNDPDWPKFDVSDQEIRKWTITNRKVLIRTITWNLCANPPPPKEVFLSNSLIKKFHIIVMGTEECERSIAQSAINPSKKVWENFLCEALAPEYIAIRSHTLQAIHIIGFIHRAIADFCTLSMSGAVACGAGNVLGNKGGVGLLLKIGSTKMLIINAHLSAHQHAEKRRNLEVQKISDQLASLLDKKESFFTASSSAALQPSSTPAIAPAPISTAIAAASTVDKPSSNISSNSSSQPMSSSLTSSEEQQQAAAVIPPLTAGGVIDADGYVDGDEEEDKVDGSNEGDLPVDMQVRPEEHDHEIVHQQTIRDILVAASSVKAQPALSINQQTPATLTIQIEESKGSGDGDAAAAAAAEVAHNSPMRGENYVTASMTPTASTVAGGAMMKTMKSVEQVAEIVIFMGDLNYRINGNRAIIDQLLAKNMHEVLLHNDQLKINKKQGLVFSQYDEPPLHFLPTYKYDVGTDIYDSGSKQRIPSWTDRILYIPREDGKIVCLGYNCDMRIQTSDHKPVYATFIVSFDAYITLNDQQEPLAISQDLLNTIDKNNSNSATTAAAFSSESQVCSIS